MTCCLYVQHPNGEKKWHLFADRLPIGEFPGMPVMPPSCTLMRLVWFSQPDLVRRASRATYYKLRDSMHSSKGRKNPSYEEEARKNPSYEEVARKNPRDKEEARKSPRYEEAADKEEVEGTGSEHRRGRQQEARTAIRLTEAQANSCNAIPHNDVKRTQKESGRETPMVEADTSCVASVNGEDDDEDSSSSYSSSSYSSSYDSPDFGNDALVATLTDQTRDEEDDLTTSLLAAYQGQSENLIRLFWVARTSFGGKTGSTEVARRFHGGSTEVPRPTPKKQLQSAAKSPHSPKRSELSGVQWCAASSPQCWL